MVERTYLGPAERDNLSAFTSVYLKMQTNPVSETLCSLRNTTEWTTHRNPVIVTAVNLKRNDASYIYEKHVT
jgi:hypothetical protein